jgi:hypothetical protein
MLRRPPVPDLLIAQINMMSRTAQSPCKPRRVVIVQGFRGHFANPWPHTVPICGSCERRMGDRTRRRGNRAAFLFCRETARYYHRLLAAT